MAKMPMGQANGVKKSTLITQTTDTYGILQPKIDNTDISSDEYTVLGAYSPGTTCCMIPYINTNGAWRLRVLSTTNSPITVVANTSYSYHFYYIKDADI